MYLLHFDRPISDRHTTQHYLGFVVDGQLGRRMELHARGAGARLTAVALTRGIGWQLARTWPGATRVDERHLKNNKEGRQLCPVCSPRCRRAMTLPSGWSRRRLRRPGSAYLVPSRALELT